MEKIIIENYSSIKVDFFSIKIGHVDAIVLAEFKGQYRQGSSGDEDSRFICSQIEMINALIHPIKMVIDFSELKYTYGDLMDDVIGIIQQHEAYLLVGKDCIKGIKTLNFTGFHSDNYRKELLANIEKEMKEKLDFNSKYWKDKLLP